MKKQYYEINANGAIIGQFNNAPAVENNFTIVHTTPPPESMLKPCWDGDRWVDNATRFEKEMYIDEQTSLNIKRWARDKGKNEEYYINCGIQSCLEKNTDSTTVYNRHYKEYRAFVDRQKEIGKAKKQALN